MAVNKDIEQVVSEHAVTIAVLVKSFGNIESYMKESVEVQKEQAVLIERLANHEEKNSDDHKNIHNRINSMREECREHHEVITERIEAVEADVKNNRTEVYGVLFILISFFIAYVVYNNNVTVQATDERRVLEKAISNNELKLREQEKAIDKLTGGN